MSHYIVFYGTLMTSHSTSVHPVIKQALHYRGQCVVPGKLYDMGRYPALKPGNDRVLAELYKIMDDGALDILDNYEFTGNTNPSLPGFSRKLVKLIDPHLEVWVYYYDGTVDEESYLPAGIWQPAD